MSLNTTGNSNSSVNTNLNTSVPTSINDAYAVPSLAVENISDKEDKAKKGIANGYAPLDSNTKVPASYLPDTASLDAEVDGKITTHNSATTSVHGIANTANLVLTNDSRLADSRQPTAHTHTKSEITDFTHTHAVTDVTGLQNALDGKQASGNYSLVSHSHGKITSGGGIPTADGGKTITLLSGGTGYSSGSALINGIAVSIGVTSGVVTSVSSESIFSAVGTGFYQIVQNGNTTANVRLDSIFAENLPLITTTNGVITTGSFGTTANTFCQGNDPRLSDNRTPTAHTHAISDVTNLQTALDGKQASGSYATLVNGTIPLTQLPTQNALDAEVIAFSIALG